MRTLNPLEDKILALIEPACADLGYVIVRIRVMGLKRKTLQIMAERAEDGLMALEDCERISRRLSALFEGKDPIQGEYALEVSSPGSIGLWCGKRISCGSSDTRPRWRPPPSSTGAGGSEAASPAPPAVRCGF